MRCCTLSQTQEGSGDMDVNWNDPDVVSLHERLAACIQQQLEDDLTREGRVADLAYFGSRAAAEILHAATGIDVYGSSGEWSISFVADPAPSNNVIVGCMTCGATEGQLHNPERCHRVGVQRGLDGRPQL
jgi:hypothetical protein